MFFFGYKYLHVTKDNVLETGTNSIFFSSSGNFQNNSEILYKIKISASGREKQNNKVV